ncbi:MAG: helix-turn-helix transcriptional regulator [Eubacteriales bacterium]
MAIGKRINFLRNLRGMTMKQLGVLVGFTEKSSDVRIAQYESCSRIPKEDLLLAIAQALDVEVAALRVPDIDSQIGLCHTLFALEDMYGLAVGEIDGEVCLRINKRKDGKANPSYTSINEFLTDWRKMSREYRDDQISKEDYDQWRYTYPKPLVQENMEAIHSRRTGEERED